MEKTTKAALLFLALILFAPNTYAADIDLSPDDVIQKVIAHSDEAEALRLEQKEAEFSLADTLAFFDTVWETTYGVRSRRDLSVGTSSSQLNERYTTLSTGLNRKFGTGTEASLTLATTDYRSELSGGRYFFGGVTLGLRQSLWQNSFGEGDRGLYDSAKLTAEKAKAELNPKVQDLLLQVLAEYWDVYILKESLDFYLARQEQYAKLQKNTQRQGQLGMNRPGEGARLRAEVGAIEIQIRKTQIDYEKANRAFLARLHLPSDSKIRFRVIDLSERSQAMMAKYAPVTFAQTRRAKLLQQQAAADQAEARSIDAYARPRLDFVLEAQSTGVDNIGPVQEDVGKIKYPNLYAGVELEIPIEGELNDHKQQLANAKRMLADNLLTRRSRDLEIEFVTSQKELELSVYNAKQARQVLSDREQVERELSRSYRSGRDSLADWIDSYSDLFNAKVNAKRALADNQLALTKYIFLREI